MELSASINQKPIGIRTRLDVLKRHHPLCGERLLEIGCGNGDYSAALRGNFGLVVATDLLWAELPLAKSQCLDVVQTSASALPFPAETFDVVLAVEVLEHVASVEDVCRDIGRVLRPGGVFCFTSPNRWFPFETHGVRMHGSYRPGRHFPGLPYLPPLHRRISYARNFKAKDLRSLLTGLGFVETATDYVPLPFDSWERGRRYIKPLLGLAGKGPFRIVSSVSVAGVYRKV